MATKAILDDLVRKGIINRYEEWGCLDEEDDLEEDIDALYFVAYVKTPRRVDRRLAEISSMLTREYNVPVFIVTFREG
jgi:hypothetical protein